MSRIKSDKVHIGNDYVLNSNEKSLNEIYNKQKLILDEAKAKAKANYSGSTQNTRRSQKSSPNNNRKSNK
ncbi:MAG: hypothetical protein L6V95_08930 [Candidatus Melainabacteria bacterium]|nr:MAG: hypothetical protein L6V95_08930 [Candidatus Melainabacteria bacterium]